MANLSRIHEWTFERLFQVVKVLRKLSSVCFVKILTAKLQNPTRKNGLGYWRFSSGGGKNGLAFCFSRATKTLEEEALNSTKKLHFILVEIWGCK